jgi:hypothetical protein
MELLGIVNTLWVAWQEVIKTNNVTNVEVARLVFMGLHHSIDTDTPQGTSFARAEFLLHGNSRGSLPTA